VHPTPLTTASRTTAEVAECEEEAGGPRGGVNDGPTNGAAKKVCGGLDGTDGLDGPDHMLMVPVQGL
jgi:hypothetical protein